MLWDPVTSLKQSVTPLKCSGGKLRQRHQGSPFCFDGETKFVTLDTLFFYVRYLGRANHVVTACCLNIRGGVSSPPSLRLVNSRSLRQV